MTETETKRARILLVDDHPIVRKGLRALIDDEGDLEVVGEAEDAASALASIERSPPDAVMVDISLQGGDGLELVRQIRARWPIPVLVLSIHDESLYAERALRAGASGYVMKEEATQAVTGALRKVIAGEIWLSEKLSGRMVRAYVQGDSPAEASPLGILSDRELQVFHLISQGIGTGEISRALNISRKTVETHRAHIKVKLGLRTGVELIQFAARYKSSPRGEL